MNNKEKVWGTIHWVSDFEKYELNSWTYSCEENKVGFL